MKMPHSSAHSLHMLTHLRRDSLARRNGKGERCLALCLFVCLKERQDTAVRKDWGFPAVQ